MIGQKDHIIGGEHNFLFKWSDHLINKSIDSFKVSLGEIVHNGAKTNVLEGPRRILDVHGLFNKHLELLCDRELEIMGKKLGDSKILSSEELENLVKIKEYSGKEGNKRLLKKIKNIFQSHKQTYLQKMEEGKQRLIEIEISRGRNKEEVESEVESGVSEWTNFFDRAIEKEIERRRK